MMPGIFMSQLSWISCINLEFSLLYSLFSLVIYFIIAVQSLSCVWIFTIPWTAVQQAPLPFTISQGLLRFMSIELVMPSHPLSSPSPPALNLSQHQGFFQRVGSSQQVARVLNFSFSISIHLKHSISSVYVTIPIYFQYVEETDQREWCIPVERSADCDGVPGGCRFLFSLIPKPWLYSDLFTATCLPIKSCFAQAGLIGFLPLLSKRVLIH